MDLLKLAKRFSSAAMGASLASLTLWAVGLQPSIACGQESAVSHTARVDKLLATIRDRQLREKDSARVAAAVVELGNLRATEAIPDLVALLTYEHDPYRREAPEGYHYTSGSSPIPYIGRHYPATLALANIGDPALPALVKVIEEHDDTSNETNHARYVISVVLAREGRNIDEFLKEAAARATTHRAKKRLLKAAQSSPSK